MVCFESVLRSRDYLVLLRHCGSFVKKKERKKVEVLFPGWKWLVRYVTIDEHVLSIVNVDRAMRVIGLLGDDL